MGLQGHSMREQPAWMRASQKMRSWEEIQSEHSAVGCAMMRFLESRKPEDERLIRDPYARLFISDEYMQEFDALQEETRQKNDWLIRVGLARERYIDDYLLEALKQGISQVILLGAGYDCRALRIKQLQKSEILVFEVDLEYVIEQKKKKLLEHLTFIPSHVRLLPNDLHKGDFMHLTQTGFKMERKSLFVAQALSYYLETFALQEIFRFIAQNCASGSQLIFDYVDPETMANIGGATNAVSYWDGLMGSQPFSIYPDMLCAQFQELGYSDIHNENMIELVSRFGVAACLPVDGWYIASCTVA